MNVCNIFELLWKLKLLIGFVILVLIGWLLEMIPIEYPLIDKIKLYGLMMQLIGICVIVISLRQKFILFNNQKSILVNIKELFRRYPLWGKSKSIKLEAHSTSHSHISANIRGVVRPSEDIKEVIKYFDEEIQYLHKRLMETKTELSKDIRSTKNEMITIKNEFHTKVDEMKSLVQESSASNIGLDLFGVMSICLGLFYGTIPELMVKWLY